MHRRKNIDSVIVCHVPAVWATDNRQWSLRIPERGPESDRFGHERRRDGAGRSAALSGARIYPEQGLEEHRQTHGHQ